MNIIKALSNDTRLQILQWLKEPEKHFSKLNNKTDECGVCCGLIHKKTALSQSTISNYLALLEKAGLIIATRRGQWTCYRRNEKTIAKFIETLNKLI